MEKNTEIMITDKELEIIQQLRNMKDGKLSIKVEGGKPCEIRKVFVHEI